jgi:hypothetical protein
MMNIDKKQLKIISLEFRTIANRLINCHWQTGMDLLRKFITYIDSNEIIREYIQSYVNPDDFKDYEYKIGEVYSSMGDSKQEEISFTYQFLKYAANNCRGNIYQSLAFGYAKEANDAVKEFCVRIILPFVNYIEGYLTEIGIQMGYDENAQFTINVNGGNPQLNLVSGNGAITATQNIGVDISKLENIIDEIRKTTNTECFAREELEQITDSLDAIKAEITSLQPKKGILRTALKGLQAIHGSAEFLAAVATIVQFISPYIQ